MRLGSIPFWLPQEKKVVPPALVTVPAPENAHTTREFWNRGAIMLVVKYSNLSGLQLRAFDEGERKIVSDAKYEWTVSSDTGELVTQSPFLPGNITGLCAMTKCFVVRAGVTQHTPIAQGSRFFKQFTLPGRRREPCIIHTRTNGYCVARASDTQKVKLAPVAW